MGVKIRYCALLSVWYLFEKFNIKFILLNSAVTVTTSMKAQCLTEKCFWRFKFYSGVNLICFLRNRLFTINCFLHVDAKMLILFLNVYLKLMLLKLKFLLHEGNVIEK